MDDIKTLQLNKKIFIKGKIIIKTGIHIGGSSLGLQIGGADNVVIRNPITNLPYIPGSSLKGKMRSLLEKSLGLVKIEQKKKNGKQVWEGNLCTDPNEDIVQLFGSPADAGGSATPTHAPTRLTVRDSDLLNEDKLAGAENTDMYCTEIKTEVNIDRLTSAANPRNFERVPAGAVFRLDLVIDIYNVDTADDNKRADEFVKLIKQGLLLIEDDYLGGHGTRGYGQVKFHIDSVTERTADYYRNGKSNPNDSDLAKIFSCFMNQQQAES
jgi:CRISPR-associated protein Csm3